MKTIVKMIAATSLNSAIGNTKTNSLPWGNDYPEDMMFFRKMTSGSTVIMGKNTFNSIGKLLPKRRNIILTTDKAFQVDGADIFKSLEDALKTCDNIVWLIGGSSVYQAGLKYAEEIYLTTIPRVLNGDNLVYFPYVNPDAFALSERIELNKEKNLYVNVYKSIL